MKIPGPVLQVVARLGQLCERVVFVGGQVAPMLITDPGAAPPRATKDVDLIIDVDSHSALESLAQQLRSLGFTEAMGENVICRWLLDELIVDVMPIDPGILGFSNAWYSDGARTAVTVQSGGHRIPILNGPHFCATKLEAFSSRGDGDYYHHDLEDVVALVDGRVELLEEIDQANEAVRAFLIQRIGELLAAPSFMEALPGQLPGDTASQARLPIVRARLRAIATLGARPTSAQEDALLAPRTGSTIAVESSNIRSIAYEATTQVLTVAFHSGGTYDYADVPRLVYQGFMNAYSKGRYHHQWIRDRYSFSRRA